MIRNILFALIFTICFVGANAQSSKDYQPKLPDYGNRDASLNPVPTSPPPPPSPIPIDGGVGFLVAAGLGYGIRKMKKQQTK